MPCLLLFDATEMLRSFIVHGCLRGSCLLLFDARQCNRPHTKKELKHPYFSNRVGIFHLVYFFFFCSHNTILPSIFALLWPFISTIQFPMKFDERKILCHFWVFVGGLLWPLISTIQFPIDLFLTEFECIQYIIMTIYGCMLNRDR